MSGRMHKHRYAKTREREDSERQMNESLQHKADEVAER